jgi:hypothetical protein
MMRKTIIAAVVVAMLAATNSAAMAKESGKDADNPTVTVQDKPGAPRDMLQQLDKLTGERHTLRQALAVDTGGAKLTYEQAEALAAGKEPDGVKILGVMRDGEKLLDTTMSDLSDGTFDGPRDSSEVFRTVVVYDLFLPGYEWCLTICISTGRSVAECVRLSRS